MSVWLDLLQKASDGADGNSNAALEAQIRWLDSTAKQLAASADLRIQAFRPANDGVESNAQAKAIELLSHFWQQGAERVAETIQVQLGNESKDTGQSSKEEAIPRLTVLDDEEESNAQTLLLRRATLAARVVRNSVAGQSHAQAMCFDKVVPSAIHTLWLSTSFALERVSGVELLTRTLAQLLSNFITENDALQHRLWREHLQLDPNGDPWPRNHRSGAELLQRLLASGDGGTSLAVCVLCLNLTISSSERSAQFAMTEDGADVLRALLQLVQQRLDEDEYDEEQQDAEDAEAALNDGDSGLDIPLQASPAQLSLQQQRFEGLGVLYAIFTNLLGRGHFRTLYIALEQGNKEELALSTFPGCGSVLPSQIALLKLLDAFLHSTDKRQGGAGLESVQIELLDSTRTLGEILQRYAKWAYQAIDAALSSSSQVSQPVDVRLAEVHVALILLVQCAKSIAIASDSLEETTERGRILDDIVSALRRNDLTLSLIALLHSTNIFSPPVSPFVAKGSPAQKAAPTLSTEAPAGHALSSTGRAAAASASADPNVSPRPRLDKLKRDLVSLVSVLAFERKSRTGEHEVQAVRRFQDSVREAGGLVDLLNLTQLDENNPYIREYAILALRNLLKGNQASQDFIAQIRPMAPDGHHQM